MFPGTIFLELFGQGQEEVRYFSTVGLTVHVCMKMDGSDISPVLFTGFTRRTPAESQIERIEGLERLGALGLGSYATAITDLMNNNDFATRWGKV